MKRVMWALAVLTLAVGFVWAITVPQHLREKWEALDASDAQYFPASNTGTWDGRPWIVADSVYTNAVTTACTLRLAQTVYCPRVWASNCKPFGVVTMKRTPKNRVATYTKLVVADTTIVRFVTSANMFVFFPSDTYAVTFNVFGYANPPVSTWR